MAAAAASGFAAAELRERLSGASKMRLASAVALAELEAQGPSPALRAAAAELRAPIQQAPKGCECPPEVLEVLRVLLEAAIEAIFSYTQKGA